ncbi:MAG: phosphatase PAP2 family protein [candidate division Zixibacteria bacterium]|nr:phosphatase PAP2 family protein [candidate division Zixibacteria bacterium]
MLELLGDIDRTMFLFFNVTISNPVTNILMPIVTSDNLLRVLYGVAMILLLWKGDSRLRWLVLFSAFALLVADQLSSQFLKPLIARPRPCHIMTDINLLVNCGAGYALPSSHATNAFAQAALFSLAARNTRWYLWAFASIVAVSRVFVGVHYPFDVFAGAFIGTAVGIAVAFGFGYFEQKRKEGIASSSQSKEKKR